MKWLISLLLAAATVLPAVADAPQTPQNPPPKKKVVKKKVVLEPGDPPPAQQP